MTKYTPENISVLQPNQVFVYGANEAGIHGKGAAKLALKWGAKYGKYRFSGQTYGIPTKNSQIETLPLEYIEEHIVDFLDFTKLHKYCRQETLPFRVGRNADVPFFG
jgi:hypothetical protein